MADKMKRKIKIKSSRGDNHCIEVSSKKETYITVVSNKELEGLKKDKNVEVS